MVGHCNARAGVKYSESQGMLLLVSVRLRTAFLALRMYFNSLRVSRRKLQFGCLRLEKNKYKAC